MHEREADGAALAGIALPVRTDRILPSGAARVLALQASAGNRAVSAFLQGQRAAERDDTHAATRDQNPAGNRAVTKLLAEQPLGAADVDVASHPDAVAFPAELVSEARRRGAVEFGATMDPSRSARALAEEALRGNTTRARLANDRLVVPGVRLNDVDATSSRSFERSLSRSLPYQRFRLRAERDELVFEGKINPWVCLLHGPPFRLEYSNTPGPPAPPPAPVGPTAVNWFWVGPLAPLAYQPRTSAQLDNWLQNHPQGPAGTGTPATAAHPRIKIYSVPWFPNAGPGGNPTISLPIKAAFSPYPPPPGAPPGAPPPRTWAGGLPSLPGGNIEPAPLPAAGAAAPPPTAAGTLADEYHQEFQGQATPYHLDPNMARFQHGHERYYVGQSLALPGGAPPTAAQLASPQYRETIGAVGFDPADPAANPGNPYTLPMRGDPIQTLIDIANRAFASLPAATAAANQPNQQQITQYLTQDYPLRTLVQTIRPGTANLNPGAVPGGLPPPP